jgi:hypothetical protein
MGFQNSPIEAGAEVGDSESIKCFPEIREEPHDGAIGYLLHVQVLARKNDERDDQELCD